MSLGSDMIDLLSLLNETNVQESEQMTLWTLSIFSWSMFQFSLNLVVNRGRSFAVEKLEDEFNQNNTNDEDADHLSSDFEDMEENGNRTFFQKLDNYVRKHNVEADVIKLEEKTNEKRWTDKICCCIPRKYHRYLRFENFDSEMWSILITMVFQDGPFLAIRLTAVIKFEVRTFVTL
jgi:hypothetical protein